MTRRLSKITNPLNLESNVYIFRNYKGRLRLYILEVNLLRLSNKCTPSDEPKTLKRQFESLQLQHVNVTSYVMPFSSHYSEQKIWPLETTAFLGSNSSISFLSWVFALLPCSSRRKRTYVNVGFATYEEVEFGACAIWKFVLTITQKRKQYSLLA